MMLFLFCFVLFYKRNSISNDTSTKTGVVGDGVVGGEKNGADF